MKRPRDPSIPTRFDDLVDSSIVSYPPNDLASLAHLIDSNGERVYIGLPEDLSGKCEVPSGFCSICPRVKGEPRKLNAAGTCTSCQKSTVRPFDERYADLETDDDGEFYVYVLLSETSPASFYVGITQVGVNARIMEHECECLSEEQKDFVRSALDVAFKRRYGADKPSPYTEPMEWLGPDTVELPDGRLARKSDCKLVAVDVRSSQRVWALKFRPGVRDPATGAIGRPLPNLTRPRDLNGETILDSEGKPLWMRKADVVGVTNTHRDAAMGQHTNCVQWMMPANETVKAFRAVKDGAVTTKQPVTVPRAYCTVRLARAKGAPDDAPPAAHWVLNHGAQFLPPARKAARDIKVGDDAEEPRAVRLDSQGRYQIEPTKSTQGRGPFILLRTERFSNRRQQRQREDFLHSEVQHADGHVCGGRRALKRWISAWTAMHRQDLHVPPEELQDLHEAAAPPKCYCARD